MLHSIRHAIQCTCKAIFSVLRIKYLGKLNKGHLFCGESESEVVSDSATPWTVAHQAPQSMEFSRQKDWSGLPFPSPGELPNPGIELSSLAYQADYLLTEQTKETHMYILLHITTSPRTLT